MKSRLPILATVFMLSLGYSQYVWNSFDSAPADTNYWAWFDSVNCCVSTFGAHYNTSDHADSAYGWVIPTYVSSPVHEGTGAMQLDWSAHNTESWGGYSKLEHWNPDSNGVYDLSAYDTISFWYYNAVPQSLPTRTHLRFNLQEVSDSPNGNATYDVNEVEYYYSFHYILDDAPGWHRIAIPLEAGDYWGGEGFNHTGWAGIQGNGQLDKDKIKGFSIEFSINGAGEGDYSQGTIVLDDLEATGGSSVPLVFFNSMAIPSNVDLWAGWGGGSYEIVEGAGYTPNTNALRWHTPPNDWAVWDGLVFTLDAPQNLWYSWSHDSLQFKIKAPAGIGDLKLVLADPDDDGFVDNDGDGADDTPDSEFEAAYTLTETEVGYDGTWKEVKIPLSSFDRFSGGWDGTGMRPGEMDSSRVKFFKMLIASTAAVNQTIDLDEIATMPLAIDVEAPAPPQGVSGVVGTYYNLVIWQDVPGESGETYNVYASQSPITDVSAPGVELVESGVGEDIQTVIHWLNYPLVDTDLTYYYAVTCADEFANVSEPGVSASPVTNTARGIPTISLNPPASFAADGDLTEWYSSGIMPFTISPSNGFVPVGSVDDDNDLTGTVFMAIDDDYLYLAGDVVDNVYSFGAGNWWDQDAFQLFIGLYDWRGPKHTSILRGDEPDYIMYANEQVFQFDNPGGYALYTPDSADYYFEGFNPDYVFEVRVPLDAIAAAGGDPRFHPQNGMRVPIDLYFHDNDGAGWEGNVGFSSFSTDHQWQTPEEWAYTWIGDTTDVALSTGNETLQPQQYALRNNYPNPFNPTTSIEYVVPRAGEVTLTIYNLMGQEVDQLVNHVQKAGTYTVKWNGSQAASGVYFYQLRAGDFVQTKKMILMK
ncbi:MAG: T9SS C-terminal target domain-containing protein [Candidatus Neomarinimicrobiota bacterium]|nr:MAG: T9SS C-terminal target domain-containing protein [Candidatus Neomarinimicrobiota bacterium]